MVNNNFGKEFQQKHTGDFDMKSLTKSVLSVLLVLTLVIASFVPAYAASGDSTTLYNEGQRDEVCTSFDNTTAPDYYTGSYTYDNLSTLSASSLKSSLNTLMSSTHKYTSSYDDCHYLADHTDCQNGDGSVSLIYTNYSATMSQWNGWNREHVWPKSLGGDTTTGGGADLHHIRPSDAVVNSTRSNNKYGNADGGKEVYGKNPATGYLGGYYADGYFEPLDNVKGDVARICLYVYVRWGSSWGATDITDVFQSVEVLLAWCELDPVDTWEMERNDVVEDIQGNRNVFIDYPEYAWLLFNETIPDDMITPSGEAMGGNTSGGSTTCTHTNKTTTTVDATCTTAGSVTVKCADCGSVVSKTTVAATGHTYVDGVCSVCGDGSTVSPPSTDSEGIEFTFGDNGTASHSDGTSKTTYSETVGGYTLNITDGSSMYTGARDAKGNSAIKMGSSSNIGSFSFTVPDDVTSVIIHAAKYKAKTSKISVNGTTTTLTSSSDAGEYDEITVDTSSTKTVSVATVTGGTRCMIDKIVYVIPSSDTPDTPSCEHTNKTTSVVGATCTTAGSETVTCDDCGEEISTTPIPATGHQNTTETTVDATCTEAGSVKLICDECGYVVSQSEIAALGHSYSDGVCSICGTTSGSTEPDSGSTSTGEVTLTFDDTSKRTTYTTSQQIWTENGITLTNDKSSSTSNVADYASPARFYKNSKITVEYPGMTKIVFTCNSSSYATDLAGSITDDSNYTVVTSGKNVTVAFVEKVDTFVISALSVGQVRMDSLTVSYEQVSVDPDCEHTNTTETTVGATCTVAGSIKVTCTDCGATVSTTSIPATGHQNTGETTVDATCTTAGSIKVICDDCGATVSTTSIPATGHQNTTETTLDANCTEAGSTTVTCDDCGATVSTTEIPALGHSYTDGTCSVCGAQESTSAPSEDQEIVFEFGDNGSATHDDGSKISSGKNYTSGEYTLVISSCTNVYGDAYDAQGNSALKFGSSNSTGSMEFTVPDEVTSVIIYAAKYKAKTSYIVINSGTAQSLTGSSDDGQYDVITVDTSTTKTITVATGTSGKRMMIDKIVYVIPGSNLPDVPTCEHTNTTTETTDATCTTAGLITTTCDDCGEEISSEVIPATGHNYTDGICSVCGASVPNDSLGLAGKQFYIATIRSSGNYFYMTSDLGTASTERYQAIDSGLTALPSYILSSVAVSANVFAFEYNEDGTYSIYAVGVSESNYLGHTGGNSGTLVDKASAVRFTVTYNEENGLYNIYYNDGTEDRYISLNNNSSNNYFAFYAGTQKQDLSLIPVVEAGFSGASLNVGSDLSIRYHAILGDNAENYTVRFTMNEKVVTVSGVAENGKYVFSFCGIAPQCMGDTIKAELLYNGEVIDAIEEYSVKQYVISALALHSTDTELCRLLSDMLYYGAAAQKYVSYKTDALVTDGVAGILSALDTVPSDSDKNRSLVTEDGADTSVEFIAAGVRFDYNNRIYVKLTTADITNVTVTVGGAELEIISLGNNTYIAYSDGISALDFDVEISFELRRSGTLIQTLTYTVNTYAWDKQDNDKIGELALALYRYGESAKEYAN